MKSRAAHSAAQRATKSPRRGETETGTKTGRGRVGHALEKFSLAATDWAGSSWAFGAAVAVILAWVVTGPIFHFSDTWQLVINTGTTIVTFLMVFLIQRAQNKESKAVHLKLNEIVAAIQGASNRLIDVESLSEEEIATLRRHYAEIAKLAARRGGILESHSIDEARARDEEKHGTRANAK
jgi:low affinity Fe/Cu permease